MEDPAASRSPVWGLVKSKSISNPGTKKEIGFQIHRLGASPLSIRCQIWHIWDYCIRARSPVTQQLG